jgi:toluene monooxygenase electron transfer component
MNAGDAATVARTLQISIENGPGFALGPQDDALLRGALRAGLAFPYECSVGGCGACRFELLDGVMETLWETAPGLSERDRKRGKRLACQSRPLGDCRIRVRIGPDSEVPAQPPQRCSAVLTGRRAVNADMMELSLRVEGMPPFRAGQYALLYPPGVSGARAYSMSNLDAGDGDWRFIVRRTPGGHGSTTLCDSVNVGERVDIDGPFGHAWLRPGARDVVCVAGGSGLGPMLSVARGVLTEDGARRVHLFLGLRSEAELGAVAELQALADERPKGRLGERLSTTVVLSAPTDPAAWRGATGFVHAEAERALAPDLTRFDFYFAGPPPMTDAMQDLLMVRHRVPFDQIRFDRYV